MIAAPSLLLLWTLASSTPATPAAPVALLSPQGGRGQGQGQPDPTPAPADPPHTLGIGGTMSVSNRGAAGGFRLFMSQHVGLDMNVGWYRGTVGGTSSSGGNTFVASPSVIVMFAKPNPQADVDVRPYAGGGVNYSYRSLGDQVRSASPSATLSQSGWGSQVFGGVEMTFSNVKALAVSLEVAHYQTAAATGFVAGHVNGTDAYLMFHFYVN